MQPHVTAILCNYNYGDYILDAVDSVLEQTYPRIGLVIIDDASTDDSWDLLMEKYFQGAYEMREETDYTSMITQHESGKVILALRLRENGGPSRARNFGIKESLHGTDYFVIIDADDVMYPNKVWSMLEAIVTLPDVGVVYADYDIWDTVNDTIITEYKEPFDTARLLEECIVHSGAMIRKDALVAVADQFGFYDENMRTCEDYDLWVRISERFVIFHLPEVLTLVRNQPQNSTRTVEDFIWKQNWQRIGLKRQARLQNVTK